MHGEAIVPQQGIADLPALLWWWLSATVDLFLLHQLGFDDLTLYDGSMGEWAKDPALPIERDERAL